jgi:hypothetical protein
MDGPLTMWLHRAEVGRRRHAIKVLLPPFDGREVSEPAEGGAERIGTAQPEERWSVACGSSCLEDRGVVNLIQDRSCP